MIEKQLCRTRLRAVSSRPGAPDRYAIGLIRNVFAPTFIERKPLNFPGIFANCLPKSGLQFRVVTKRHARVHGDPLRRRCRSGGAFAVFAFEPS
ncbi:hypothetical protein GCM10007386_57550 [Pseudoduganella dura]|nr:hypothetical protein GCM10007386_57550 [Pseudoduganella dura]